MAIGLIATGEFGRDVCAHLVDHRYPVFHILQLEMFGPLGERHQIEELELDGIVFLMWRPSDADCEPVEDFAFDVGIPWLPLVLDHPYISVGPWLVPPDGPCLRCLRTRLLQHTATRSRRARIREAYDSNPEWGARGHLPAHVQLASGLIKKAVEGGAKSPSGAAHESDNSYLTDDLVRYDLVTGIFSRHRVVACHGCPRCHRMPLEPGEEQLLESASVGEPK